MRVVHCAVCRVDGGSRVEKQGACHQARPQDALGPAAALPLRAAVVRGERGSGGLAAVRYVVGGVVGVDAAKRRVDKYVRNAGCLSFQHS